jgi:hypothetical protein
MGIEERQAHWRSIINDQSTSGKNIAAYCRAIHIDTCLFYSWRRRLNAEPPRPGTFVELKPVSPGASGICLRLDERFVLEVDQGFDPSTLRAIVAALS